MVELLDSTVTVGFGELDSEDVGFSYLEVLYCESNRCINAYLKSV